MDSERSAQIKERLERMRVESKREKELIGERAEEKGRAKEKKRQI